MQLPLSNEDYASLLGELGIDPSCPTRPVSNQLLRPSPSPWGRAQDVASFLESTQADQDWLVDEILAPFSVTAWMAPRGLGKTHVAHALIIAVAVGGQFRDKPVKQGPVLLIDRDNSKREIRRRLLSATSLKQGCYPIS